jgi:hypothetical protein
MTLDTVNKASIYSLKMFYLGVEVLRNEAVLTADEWVDVQVERTGGRTRLTVNGVEAEQRRRPDYEAGERMSSISIATPLIIGGHVQGIELPIHFKSLPSFAGCFADPVSCNAFKTN